VTTRGPAGRMHSRVADVAAPRLCPPCASRVLSAPPRGGAPRARPASHEGDPRTCRARIRRRVAAPLRRASTALVALLLAARTASAQSACGDQVCDPQARKTASPAPPTAARPSTRTSATPTSSKTGTPKFIPRPRRRGRGRVRGLLFTVSDRARSAPGVARTGVIPGTAHPSDDYRDRVLRGERCAAPKHVVRGGPSSGTASRLGRDQGDRADSSPAAKQPGCSAPTARPTPTSTTFKCYDVEVSQARRSFRRPPGQAHRPVPRLRRWPGT